MRTALDAAAIAKFRVEPNPIVVAVLVDRRGELIHCAAHACYGQPHAEAGVLRGARQAAANVVGATLYVTLEPCAHTEKKTPPCVPSIVESGVARVVAGAPDPNRATAGRAAKAFAAAGVKYELLPESDEDGAACRALIARYARHLDVDRPWTIAKWATSLDGRIADASGASRWVSSEASRSIVRDFRASCDAVVVGAGTVVADDPQLVSRRDVERCALRVVFDSHLRTPTTAKLVATARETPTLVVAARDADAARRTTLESAGAQVVEVPAGADGRVDVVEALRELHRRGVRRALLEAGGTLQAACMRAGVVDQVAAFVAPVVLGGGGPTPFAGDGWPIASAPRLEEVRVTPVGTDALIEGYWPRV
jgi:diaminohydroxyphosphoribosylaminopyrimidine deaminase/5-amino-6-(5-phosphoribosylamino)uracil reductase